MKISERLGQLRTTREGQVKAMEALLAKSIEEGRSFDGTEQSAFDDHQSQIGTLDKEIDNCEVMEKALIKSAITPTNAGAGGSGVDVGNGRIQVVRNLPKGAAFTRYAMSLAAAKGNTVAAVEIAKERWSKDTPEVEAVLRSAVAAGTTTDTTWASPLAQYTQMAAEFIELLRAETFVGRMSGFRNVPFLVRMPRQTAGATAGWVGEGSPKPMSALAFDSVTIPHTKIAVIVAITEELARFSSPSAEATVRQDLVNAIAEFMDKQMVDPTIAAVSDVSPASITYASTTINSGGTTVALVTADLNTALTAMATANIAQRNRYWLLHPRTANYLMTLRTAQDVFAFRDEMIQGRLLGVPFLTSANMPLIDQTSPSDATLETYIVLVEASEIFLADDGEVVLDVSREASLQMNTAPSAGAQSLVSLWQNNLVGIRAERFVYWSPRRAAAVYIIKQVAY
jgi:HK97 family phage major capsid protein